jgi:serine/threonine-protein kinase
VDHIKLLDFGLAKPAVGAVNLTNPGIHVGTPGYMAPEQIYGLPISPATDLYALGCVAYWLLAGVTPFEADAAGEVLRMHAQTPAPALSARAKQPIPARLEALVMRCLAKEPADRPEDADRMREELAALAAGAPWPAAEAHSWWEAHRKRG